MSKQVAIVRSVLARFESSSKPGSFHEVRLGADGNIYCSCPSWRFQHNHPQDRSCKHIVSFKERVGMDTSNEPVAIRPVRRSARKVAPRAEVPSVDVLKAARIAALKAELAVLEAG